jgi:hypothetical protein
VDDVASLGVRRISLGGAWPGPRGAVFMRATKTILEQGRFDGLADAAWARS